MPSLVDILKPQRLTAIVDVGANPIDGHPPYMRMLSEGLCSVVGFEPLTAARAQLDANKGLNETYLPHVIGDGTSQTLHVTYAQGLTSLLKPNQAHLALFGKLSEYGRVIATETVETVRLDDAPEVTAIDFLKMDVQGAEMQVLRSGRNKLADAVAIMTEVSFITLYEGQSHFGAIDTELRDMGFVPHCFAESKVWPLVTRSLVPPDPHQMLEADMIYMRDIAQGMSVEQWKHLALIADHVCGSFDLAMRAVEVLVAQGAVPADACEQYRQHLLEH